MKRVQVKPPPFGLSAFFGVALALGLLIALLWATEPKQWCTAGSLYFGRGYCSSFCRVRGAIADILGPNEGEHCLCGSAYGTWE
jgi:hypothetical protein